MQLLSSGSTIARSLGFLFLSALPLGAAPVAAQAPGAQRIDIGSVRAEYVAEVLDRINDLLADWGDAWAGDHIDELSELYWEDALLIPPDGELRRGRNEIRGYFTDALPAQGRIEAFMLDFDAAGGMSQVFGNYMLGVQNGGGAEVETRGRLITVYVLRSRRWRIRSQVFLPGG